MLCPKCEKGNIRKIVFKKSGDMGLLCDFCDTTWLDDEEVTSNSGHSILSFTKDGDMEYTYSVDEKSEEIATDDELDVYNDEDEQATTVS